MPAERGIIFSRPLKLLRTETADFLQFDNILSRLPHTELAATNPEAQNFQAFPETETAFFHPEKGTVLVKDPTGKLLEFDNAINAADFCVGISDNLEKLGSTFSQTWLYPLAKPILNLTQLVGWPELERLHFLVYGHQEIQNQYHTARSRIAEQITVDRTWLLHVRENLTNLNHGRNRSRLSQVNAALFIQHCLVPNAAMLQLAKLRPFNNSPATQTLIGGSKNGYIARSVAGRLQNGDFRGAHIALAQAVREINEVLGNSAEPEIGIAA